MRDELFQILEDEILTEENTDKLIDLIFDNLNLPWYVPTVIAKRVLDRVLPEVLLTALRRI